MWKFGSVIIPTSAVILLSVVSILLVILLLMILCLNKVCCFANCEMPTSIFVEDSSKLLTDSESDDSDEEIFTNYTRIEKAVMPIGKEGNCLKEIENCEKDTVNGSNKALGKSESILKKNGQNKTSIVRINISHDALTSKLKLQILQVFDLGKPSGVVEGSKRPSIVELPAINVYQIHCSILPEKKHRFKTKLRQGADPMFNETFYVHKITIDEATPLSLRFRLYVSQRSSNFNIVGQCLFALNSIDLTVDSEYNLTMTEPDDDESLDGDDLSITGSEIMNIKSTKIEGYEDVPELQLGLSHNSNTGRLTVEIIRGINLSKDKNKDFYVKLSLFSSSGSELSHTKTSVRKNTISPVFRESFMFQVALFQLSEVTLMVSIFAKKSIHRKTIVGWIALGYKASGEEELLHWNEIKQGNSNQVIRNHRLQQNANSKKLLE